MKIRTPAKINLFLQINYKRDDGYHDLTSLMCCVGLYDEIQIEFGMQQPAVRCHHPEVPEDESNLALRAARLFGQESGFDECIHLSIAKQIPVAAGLGGGSSDAAAVLTALNRHYGDPFTTEQLMSMGLKLGADVPFFIFNRPAIARGIGEKLIYFKGLKPFYVVLVYPPVRVSTASVYANVNLGLTNCKQKLNSQFFNKERIDSIADILCNDLEQVTIRMHPVIAEIKRLLIDRGANGALMSGSGPSVFGLFTDKKKAFECRAAVIATNNHWRCYLTELLL